MSRLVGAYVCPRGVFAAEFRRRRGALEVVRTLGNPARLETATDAADHLVKVLASADIGGASVAIALRGFDIVHHVLALPPAKDNLLRAIVDRELRRLEPGLLDPLIAWTRLPGDPGETDPGTPAQILVAACPREAGDVFTSSLRSAGHKLLLLTALPAAVQRLNEELIEPRDTTGFVAPLPDGQFLGFFIHGSLRLVVEPPMLESDDVVDGTALVEEVELGATFVRQQFRGAQLDSVTFAQGGHSFAETEQRLSERLGVPVRRLDIHGLSSAALLAMGAVLDAQSRRPLALAGAAADRIPPGPRTYLRRAANAAVIVAGVVGAWALVTALSARDAAHALQDVRRQVEQESFGMTPMQATADQRRLIRDAVETLRFADADRLDLQNALAALGGAIPRQVRLDSLRLHRASNGWIAAFAGSVAAESNGRAVQTLHDFYGALPQQARVEDLALEQLSYADAANDEALARVRFRLSFHLPTGRDGKARSAKP